jgi:hypothetical protein
MSARPATDIIAEIWPKNAPNADPSPRIAPAMKQVRRAESGVVTANRIAEAPANEPEIVLRDMPDTVLDSRLGELCYTRMSAFPRAYAWHAVLPVASVRVPRAQGTRANLYSGLVGPVHSGKTQAIQYAEKLFGVESPIVMDMMCGSAEGLTKEVGDAAGEPRLFSPDELGHLLEKSKIENSSYSFILNRAYSQTGFKVRMRHGQVANFNCELSIVGGLVEERFQDLFGAATTGGLYDRFIFGLCPGNFVFDYFPFDDVRATQSLDHPVPVTIDSEVWKMKSQWRADNPGLNMRIVEHAIRAATVCASFDGRRILRASNLGTAWEFIKYQTKIRKLLQPNPGKNFEAIVAHKILDYLGRFHGRFVKRREMFRAIHAYEYGPSTAERALTMLDANGDVVIQKVGKQTFIRLVSDQEENPELRELVCEEDARHA